MGGYNCSTRAGRSSRLQSEEKEHKMRKFIAIRRKPRHAEVSLSTEMAASKRSARIKDAPDSEYSAVLRGLGLHQVKPDEPAPEPKSSFQRFGYVGAYLVNTKRLDEMDRAAQELENEYLIVPNIKLELPETAVSHKKIRRPRKKPYWPADSGILAAHDDGITGQGVLVGVLDTGCDSDHLELRDKRIEYRYVPLDPFPDTIREVRGFDVQGHGTHVCGILAGKNVGVAPDVDLMVASVIESETLKTSLERIVVALDWMLSCFELPQNLTKPTIVSMSLGFKPGWVRGGNLPAVMEGIQLILSTLMNDFDVLPVVAIGNDGAGTVRAPAYFPETLSVGAVDFELSPASFSGGGICPLGHVEPDIAGYGVNVPSSLERDIDRRSWYARMDGTSMATPYVAGIAALCASASPQLQGEALRLHLLDHALQLGSGPERVGAGLARFV